MAIDIVGPKLAVAVVVLGGAIGWRVARVREGDADVPAAGFFRGTTRPMRVGASAFGGALLGFSLCLLSWYLDSTGLAYLSLAVGTLSIGIGWGAIARGQVDFFRR